jgi:hypothetical protein
LHGEQLRLRAGWRIDEDAPRLLLQSERAIGRKLRLDLELHGGPVAIQWKIRVRGS